MSTDITVHSSKYQVEDRSWLVGTHGVDITPGITLDISKFSRNGTAEAQKITVAGDPTSITLTGPGGTTDDITFGSTGADASDIQSALEALSGVGTGNVTVTGDAGGPYTATFAASLGDVDALTGDTTGGTSASVTVSTTTAGVTAQYPNGYVPSGMALGKITASGLYGPYDDDASDGRETCAGLLFGSLRAVDTNTGDSLTKVGGALFIHGLVNETRLPSNSGIDDNGKADLSLIAWL